MKDVLWVKAARKEFETFPAGAREIIQSALVIAAEGRKADIAKPMKGLGSGVWEIALPYRSDAYRVVYAVQIVISRWWLARFRFGPAEWLWRSATYGRWQPLLRAED